MDHGPWSTDHGEFKMKNAKLKMRDGQGRNEKRRKALKSAKTEAILTAKPMIGGAAKYAK
jgi:hypothetical protein